MEKITGIEIPGLGMLRGRDCIHLDTVTQDGRENMVFKGEINGDLTEIKSEKEWIPYTLSFHHVLACFSCELDTYLNTYGYPESTVFNIAENSIWLEKLKTGEDCGNSAYKHYQLFTYDTVFNIIADSFDIICG